MPATLRTSSEFVLPFEVFSGTLRESPGPRWMPRATWYTCDEVGDTATCRFAAGSLVGMRYLTADMLLDGAEASVFMLYLSEGESGPTFSMRFSLLNRAGARVRIPLEAVNQNRWKYPREGAWLKPLAGGDRVDLARVDRLALCLYRKGDRPARWCMTPFKATAQTPRRLTRPMLPCGPLVDDLGQSTQRHWPTRTQSALELSQRLRQQLVAAPSAKALAGFSPFGGDAGRKLEATGYFRRHHDGRRWWLVDPDGHPFWSAGPDCVRAEITALCESLESAMETPPPRATRSINHVEENFVRVFGRRSWRGNWSRIAFSLLHQIGFNTVGNWSEWHLAQEAGFPYVRPLDCTFATAQLMYRGFPDVFAPEFEDDAAAIAGQLADTRDDRALIGYFLMNEPQWGFSSESPAAGMLYTCKSSHTRRELARFLRARYGDGEGLARAWQMAVALDDVEQGLWRAPLTTAARADLELFSSVMVTRFFSRLTDACRKVDTVHLNLGARYHTVPPSWAIEGMKCFDVFSMNCYRDRIPHDKLAAIAELLGMPTLIGEFHYGALDVGLPASGIMRVANQQDRGRAYRAFVEDAAADPNCVGAHYFTLYDQSALGRYDGENYAVGFVDVCNRPYEPLVAAARAAHERLYHVATGKCAPYADTPTYLPPVF